MSKLSLNRAVELAGGQVALAAVIREEVPDSKVIQGHIWKWLNLSKEEVPPAEYVIAIARGLKWAITPHQLRGDIYPHPQDGMPRIEEAA